MSNHQDDEYSVFACLPGKKQIQVVKFLKDLRKEQYQVNRAKTIQLRFSNNHTNYSSGDIASWESILEKTEPPTILALDNGKYYIPPHKYNEFLKYYANDVIHSRDEFGMNHSKINAAYCFSEQRTPVFKMHFDFDIIEEKSTFKSFLIIIEYIKHIQDEIASFYSDEIETMQSEKEKREFLRCLAETYHHLSDADRCSSTPDDDGGSGGGRDPVTKKIIENSPSIVFSQYPRKEFFKIHLHLRFPNVLVDSEKALWIRESVVERLKSFYGLRPYPDINAWESVVDHNIYLHCGMRMLYSYKSRNCEQCHNHEEKKRACKNCKHKGKLPILGSAYLPFIVVDGDGKLNDTLSERYRSNVHWAIQQSSIRTKTKTKCSRGFSVYLHAPIPRHLGRLQDIVGTLQHTGHGQSPVRNSIVKRTTRSKNARTGYGMPLNSSPSSSSSSSYTKNKKNQDNEDHFMQHVEIKTKWGEFIQVDYDKDLGPGEMYLPEDKKTLSNVISRMDVLPLNIGTPDNIQHIYEGLLAVIRNIEIKLSDEPRYKPYAFVNATCLFVSKSKKTPYYILTVSGRGSTFCFNKYNDHTNSSVYFMIRRVARTNTIGITQKCCCTCPIRRRTGKMCKDFVSQTHSISDTLKCLMFPELFLNDINKAASLIRVPSIDNSSDYSNPSLFDSDSNSNSGSNSNSSSSSGGNNNSNNSLVEKLKAKKFLLDTIEVKNKQIHHYQQRPNAVFDATIDNNHLVTNQNAGKTIIDTENANLEEEDNGDTRYTSSSCNVFSMIEEEKRREEASLSQSLGNSQEITYNDDVNDVYYTGNNKQHYTDNVYPHTHTPSLSSPSPPSIYTDNLDDCNLTGDTDSLGDVINLYNNNNNNNDQDKTFQNKDVHFFDNFHQDETYRDDSSSSGETIMPIGYSNGGMSSSNTSSSSSEEEEEGEEEMRIYNDINSASRFNNDNNNSNDYDDNDNRKRYSKTTPSFIVEKKKTQHYPRIMTPQSKNRDKKKCYKSKTMHLNDKGAKHEKRSFDFSYFREIRKKSVNNDTGDLNGHKHTLDDDASTLSWEGIKDKTKRQKLF